MEGGCGSGLMVYNGVIVHIKMIKVWWRKNHVYIYIITIIIIISIIVIIIIIRIIIIINIYT